MGTYTTEFTICSEVGVAEDQDTQSTVNQHSSLTSRPAFLYSLCRMELKCNWDLINWDPTAPTNLL